MRTYEAIFIVHPEVIGDDLSAVIDKYKMILTEQGANVFKAENWGTRTLAYSVKKQAKGCYVLFIFDAEPKVIAEFERRMRIDDKIIKFQTVHLEAGYQAPVVVENPSQDAGETDEDAAELSDEATADDEETTEEA
jgi:small subunit ribosomal protein S6